jgi:para-nitrobenzyl esterase
MKACEPDVATAIAEETLAELGVGAHELHRLTEMPWEQLLNAQHIDIAHELAEGSNRDGVLRYYPVVDGRSLPAHPFDPVASALCADVPMMTGSARDSMRLLMLMQPWFGTLDEAGLREIANKQLGTGAEEVVAAIRREHPEATPTDVACAVITGRVMTAKTIDLAERKAVGGDAPVYLYRWDYRAPGMDGMAGARHGGELAFVFKTIGMTSSEGFADVSPFEGDRPQDYAMQDVVSETWVRFAHQGDPNHDAIPAWPSYTTDDRPTMVFDDEVRLVHDPDALVRVAYERVPPERWM